jgi:hypothetical protein
MRFDGSLGNVQIASDFRVVTSLKKQIYDLPFPGTHLVEVFFHKHCTWPMRPGLLQVAKQSGSLGTSGFGSLRLILHSRGQIGPGMLTNCKNSGCALFRPQKRGLLQCFEAGTTAVLLRI